MTNFNKICHYYLAPIILMISTPIISQYLVTIGQDKEFLNNDLLFHLIGNHYTWAEVFIILIWGFVWLKLPSHKTYGPVTYYNEKPEFKDNGFLYYIITLIVYIICQLLWKPLSSTIFINMPSFIGSLNITAFILCICLFIKGIKAPEHPNETTKKLPKIFLFYSGIELHPRFFGVQIKQLTNCRVGLMLWQILVLAFFITGCKNYGFNYGSFVNFFLQMVYLAKFFWWESGYFWTLDIALDKAGYYLCWGCMVFVPAFYTFTSYYLVLHPPILPNYASVIILIFGLFATIMNYRVDYEKELFQENRFNNDFKLWGKKVEYIKATYTNVDGNIIESRLLISGCWGIARHLNYFFEILIALSWSLPGIGLDFRMFCYPIFILFLLLHRCFRDEQRCLDKYGDAYRQYCEKVPYRIIPYIF